MQTSPPTPNIRNLKEALWAHKGAQQSLLLGGKNVLGGRARPLPLQRAVTRTKGPMVPSPAPLTTHLPESAFQQEKEWKGAQQSSKSCTWASWKNKGKIVPAFRGKFRSTPNQGALKPPNTPTGFLVPHQPQRWFIDWGEGRQHQIKGQKAWTLASALCSSAQTTKEANRPPPSLPDFQPSQRTTQIQNNLSKRGAFERSHVAFGRTWDSGRTGWPRSHCRARLSRATRRPATPTGRRRVHPQQAPVQPPTAQDNEDCGQRSPALASSHTSCRAVLASPPLRAETGLLAPVTRKGTCTRGVGVGGVH